MKRTAALAFALTLALCGSALAQTGQMYGELVGKLTDTSGAALPGVTVTLSGPAVMGSMTATTTERGQYRFPAVNSGTYKLKFQLPGFAPVEREGIIVPVRSTVTVDAQMKLAQMQETLTVSEASPVVDVENAKVGGRLDQSTLQQVPTARTIFGSTTLLPGMVMGRQDPGGLNASTSTGMVAHGASNYNLNYYGVTADTPQDYGSMYYMDFGSAEEISVDTAAMGAEIGGGGGANINIVPKSGSNKLKGRARNQARHSKTPTGVTRPARHGTTEWLNREQPSSASSVKFRQVRLSRHDAHNFVCTALRISSDLPRLSLPNQILSTFPAESSATVGVAPRPDCASHSRSTE